MMMRVDVPKADSLRAAVRVAGEDTRTASRLLAEEVPVALVFDGSTQAVMMASPIDLEDFALGFALTEAIVAGADEIEQIDILPQALDDDETGIELRIRLASPAGEALARRRRSMAGPLGCGLCGLESLEEALRDVPLRRSPVPAFTMRSLMEAPDRLRDGQSLHDRTRAVHAAGFLTPRDGMVLLREDVGRHNALDKLIGALRQRGLDAAEGAVVLTSRISVDMVQKSAMAGCPVLVSPSAPTALAVRLAERAGIVLAAYAQGGSIDILSNRDQLMEGPCDVA